MGDLFLVALGYIILRFKYPNKKERQRILKETYNDSYLTAGIVWPLKIIGAIFFVALLSFLIIIIYRILFFPPAAT